MAGRGRASARACSAVIAVTWMLAGASQGPVSRADGAAAGAVAVRHRIQLPDGSQLLLRREYRVIFRTPMRWSEGLLLERVYVAGCEAGARVSRAT